MTNFIYDFFYGEECLEKLRLDAEHHENYFSMWRLAQIAQENESEDECVYWLEKIYYSSWQFAEQLIMVRKDPVHVYVSMYMDALIWSSVFYYSYEKLADYYLSQREPKKIQQAIEIYRILMSMEGGKDTSKKIDCAVELLSKIKNHGFDIKEALGQLKNISDQIGEDAWNKLSPQSQAYITTAQYIFYNFLNLEEEGRQGLDYSCVILPLMKALEMELKIIFSQQYLKYLHEQVKTPVKYCELNGLTQNQLKHEWVIYRNSSVHFKISDLDTADENVPAYVYARFTLGNLNHIIGEKCDSQGKVTYYKTAIDFCRQITEEDPAAFFGYVTSSINLIRPKRNEAAHPGTIPADVDAWFCWNQVILINKLIRNIVLGKME